MYLNTGETDWPSNWYCIFDENLKKNKLKKDVKDKIKYPILLQHGNNPGLVSHFVKEALVYVVNTQYKKNKEYKKLIKENKFNELAKALKVKMIHVNDIDLQKIDEEFNDSKLISTWCIDSFFFELLSEATQNIGTHENIDKSICKKIDIEKGFLEYKDYAVDKKIKTIYPDGYFEGYLVPHEETITIANSLEVYDDNNIIYRPSVMFVYKPCKLASEYLEKSRTDIIDEQIAVRGHLYPKDAEVVYKEKIKEGTEYVGILLMGDNFEPVWVGNRVEMNYLYKQKHSYWQTPTITPVAMSALAGLCWMIKNKEKGDIYFPDDIKDYKYVLKLAEKYISKTIYHTFDKDLVYKELGIKELQSNNFYV
jgi:homospermidine synthase